MRRAGAAERPGRRAVAWMMAKLTEGKTRVDDLSAGPLYRLELIEALGVGVDGKRALWTALATAAAKAPALQGIDYDRLIRRADEQRRIVETARLDAATEALRVPSPSRGRFGTGTHRPAWQGMMAGVAGGLLALWAVNRRKMSRAG
jgi:hypothetical protein